MASLEGGEAAMATASGMAAISSVMLSLLNPGDEAVIDHTVYGNTFAYFTQALTRFGIVVKLAGFACRDRRRTGRRTDGVVFFETPANPNLRVIDIAGIARIARKFGALVVVDNTFATRRSATTVGIRRRRRRAFRHRISRRPWRSSSASWSGTADIVKQARQTGLRWMTGATLSPFNCFLLLRGLKTLELRLERHSVVRPGGRADAQHPKIATISYPGLETFPQHELAKRQMSAFGGLIAFELDGGFDMSMALMNKLKLVTRAVSLGDTETLIQHPASMTHAIYGAEERARHGISDGLLRLSVGLENVDDIIDDLEQALAAL